MFWLKLVLVAGAVGVVWWYWICYCCTTKILNAKQKGTLLVWMYMRSLQTWRGNSSSTVKHLKHTFAKMSCHIVWLHRTKNNPQTSWIPDLLLIKMLAVLHWWFFYWGLQCWCSSSRRPHTSHGRHNLHDFITNLRRVNGNQEPHTACLWISAAGHKFWVTKSLPAFRYSTSTIIIIICIRPIIAIIQLVLNWHMVLLW